ncbi:TPA: PerC family transcriptional regulator [Enterobacter ludwigii]
MSLMKHIQLFISNNPGLTNKEIAASMPEFHVHAVQRAVCHLVNLKRATRKHNGKCYEYFAEPPEGEVGEVVSRVKVDRALNVRTGEKENPSNPEILSLQRKAKNLFEKGLYQRAATVLIEAFKLCETDSMRERILKERQRCLSRVRRIKSPGDGWCLAGRARNV